ncbi:hypothetical protein MLDJOKPK_00027 [Salmonella phage SPAsTU]|nr:hypothetical protein MLDJOKPK_00027 [Salmonella phage SPAsTU]
MTNVQNSRHPNITIRVAKPMRFDGTVMIDRDIDAVVSQLNSLGVRQFAVYPIHGYPDGPFPQQELDAFINVLDACVANPTEETADKLMVTSVHLRGIAKMGNNACIGKGNLKLADYWAKQ